MNRILKTAFFALLLFALPAMALCDAPVMLLELPENAQMVENVEFENGDFIQTYQLEGGVTVQLLRYSGFAMTMDELISSNWPVNCGVVVEEMEISGIAAQHAHVYQAIDAEGYPVKADGKESGVMEIDLVLVNTDDTALIVQSTMTSGGDAEAVAAILSTLQVQGGENAEVG